VLKLGFAVAQSTVAKYMTKRPDPSCLYRKVDSAIMVMKSAEDRHSCDAAYVLNGAMDRSVLIERPMCPQLVIVGGILRQNPA
jgi:hypothetical protein